MVKEIVTSELQHRLGQPGSVLPYWQVFKMVISHRGKKNYKLRQGAVKRFNTLGWGGGVSNLEFGIWNLKLVSACFAR